MIVNECKSLADRLQAKRDAGLVDIKFYLFNAVGAEPADVYAEADALLAATETPGLVEDFAFDDRHAA